VTDPVRQIADAVLYEGYILWPYRRSALKNRQRWTFGGVYPPEWSAGHPDDPSLMQTQCLLEHDVEARVEVSVRFLHVVRRRIRAPGGEYVDELTVDGERHVAWEEAAEREVALILTVPTGGAATARAPVQVPADTSEEPLGAGAIVRSWRFLEGVVDARADPVAPGVARVTTRILNATPLDARTRGRALEQTFCSAHTVLRARDGAFVSQTDPPAPLAEAAAGCRNVRAWPVLVGEPGARNVVLSSPIILEDHPRIAPESPGDLFDGGEVDQLLTLSILSMTDEEKREMREADPRAREILERTEALSEEELMRLHGAIREFSAVRP
jgi:hypothetical protein